MSSQSFPYFLKKPATDKTSHHTGGERSSTSSTASTKQLAAASSRITGTVKALERPSRDSLTTALDHERARAKEMEETIRTQKATIEALNRDNDRMAVENAELSQATNRMYRELAAQTQWLEGLNESVGEQAGSGREVLRAYRRYRP